MSDRLRGAVVVLALGLCARSLRAQTPIKVGPKLQVNTTTNGFQGVPAVAGTPDGRFVVVWHQEVENAATGADVLGQRFGADGTKAGSEFPVNAYTMGDQALPQIAMHPSGSFVVVWRGLGADGFRDVVRARRFDAASSPVGDEFRISANTDTNKGENRPLVALDSLGNFVVVWTRDEGPDNLDIIARLFDANGQPRGDEFPVNTYTANYQDTPAVAMEPNGNFVVVWSSYGQDGPYGSIVGRRFDAAGVPRGDEFLVHPYSTLTNEFPSVSVDPTGRSVVAWDRKVWPDGSGIRVFARRFDTNGAPQGDEFPVDSPPRPGSGGPSVSVDPGGNFVVAWSTSGVPDPEVLGRRFDATGLGLGLQFGVDASTTALGRPRVATRSDGGFVVVWDRAAGGIAGQRFVVPDLRVAGPATVAAGAVVQLIVANGPGNTKDWVGLYGSAAPDMPALDWKYLNGMRTPPTAGASGATLTFTAPSTPGTYNFRFFQNNTYTKLATSTTITVAAAVAPTLTVSTTTALPGQIVQVTAANGPGNPKDWVGLHGSAAADMPALDWKYLSGTRTAPVVGLAGATLNFAMPATPGTYNFRFFQKDTYSRLATSALVTVAAASSPTLTLSTTTATPGQVVQVTVANGPGNAKDWVGLHGSAAVDTALLDWKYLNGTRTPPATGLSAATFNLAVPTTPGTYNFRFFQNNTYTKLATSAPLTVGPASTPSVTLNTTTAAPGQVVQVTVSNGPGNATDWLGLYGSAAADTALLDWKYLSGNRTAPATGLTAATVSFSVPLTPGTYNFRFFANNGYGKLATSPTLTVQ